MIVETTAVSPNRTKYKVKSDYPNKDGDIQNGVTPSYTAVYAYTGSYKFWSELLGKWIVNTWDSFFSFNTNELVGKQIEKVVLNLYLTNFSPPWDWDTGLPLEINYGLNLISNPLHQDDDTKDWIKVDEFSVTFDAHVQLAIPVSLFPSNGEFFDIKANLPSGASGNNLVYITTVEDTVNYPFLEVTVFEPRNIIRLGMSELPDEDFPMPDEEIIGG